MSIQIEAIAEISTHEIDQVVTQSSAIHDFVKDISSDCIANIDLDDLRRLDLDDLMRDYNDTVRDIAYDVFESEKDNLDIPDEFTSDALGDMLEETLSDFATTSEESLCATGRAFQRAVQTAAERMLNNQNLGNAFVGYDDYIDQKHKMKTLEDSHARLQIQVMQMTTAFEKIGIAMDPFKRVPTIPVDVVGTTIVARTTFDG
tara:strand:- start:156 stop:764 length:609 start_codon:yes stop_codon:yes gene_type:complete